MQRARPWLLRGLLALIVITLLAGWGARDRLARLHAVNTLFEADKIVANFSGMDQAFLSRPVARGDVAVSPLPQGAPITFLPEIDLWITDRSVTSLIVLKRGEIVHESYHLGTHAPDLRISWSIAKSFLSALLGVLIDEGAIESLDIPVTRHAPALTGGAYDRALLRDVVQMSSGVAFNEDYKKFSSDINRMGRVLALGRSMDAFATGLSEVVGPPGTRWRYVSIDTHIIGMVIRGATGRDIPDLMSEKIIVPLGLEAEPYILTDGQGTAFVLGGLNLTSRDYARFGLMISQNGRLGAEQIVPSSWIAEATRASAPTAAGESGYGYQWWVPEDARAGEFLARGVYGQYLYIDQARDVVIVVTAADRAFTAPGRHRENLELLRSLSARTDE
ncbi:MAG: serine hydrolase [Pseudomonadota bacterium]